MTANNPALVRLRTFAEGGPFVWRDAAQNTDFNQLRADLLAALSATPAPSDQDASQAQGEVLNPVGLREAIARYALEDRWAEDEQVSLNIADEVLQLVHSYQTHSLAKPAPGATAQDGVGDCEFCLGAKGGVKGNENVSNGIVVCDYCSALLRKIAPTPTPTIPAGMVARAYRLGWLRGTNPNGWDEQDDVTSGDAIFDNQMREDLESDYPCDTPLAAAPKQAEQQGVEEAICAVLERWDAHPSDPSERNALIARLRAAFAQEIE